MLKFINIVHCIKKSEGKEKILYIDKEKYILAEEKDRSNKVIERLLKTISF
jgi:hypothetical protein